MLAFHNTRALSASEKSTQSSASRDACFNQLYIASGRLLLFCERTQRQSCADIASKCTATGFRSKNQSQIAASSWQTSACLRERRLLNPIIRIDESPEYRRGLGFRGDFLPMGSSSRIHNSGIRAQGLRSCLRSGIVRSWLSGSTKIRKQSATWIALRIPSRSMAKNFSNRLTSSANYARPKSASNQNPASSQSASGGSQLIFLVHVPRALAPS